MASQILTLMIGTDHPVPIVTQGNAVVAVAAGSAALYYGDTAGVSQTFNSGSITAGNSQTFTNPQVWLRSAGLSTVVITITAPTSGGGSATVSPASVAAAQPFVVDLPENHGAVRDGVTDDTAAIQATINAAVAAGIANGSNYAEVWFTAGIYQVTSAPAGHGTPTFANSQITLPFIASGTSAQKFTLKLKGLSGAGVALPHWNQTVGQKGGAVIRSTATGTNDGTWGPASVIGGPTVIQGYGGGSGNAWSNMLAIVDGLSIMSSTPNPTMCGFNFEGLLEAKVISGGYFADATPTVMNGFITTSANFTNQWVFGLAMPACNNNDLCIVDDWSAEGVWYGIQISEHTHVLDMRSIYCGWGIMLDNRVATPHWSQVDFASAEICVNTMGVLGATGTFKVNIDRLDCEGTIAIWDGNSLIVGNIGVAYNQTPGKVDWTGPGLSGWIGNWGATPTNGHNMRVTSTDVLPGMGVNQPTVPASTVDFWNKSLRDCAVTITGGTVTVIAVDGTATGLAATGHTVIVPTGKKITLTYSVAPSWVWCAL